MRIKEIKAVLKQTMVRFACDRCGRKTTTRYVVGILAVDKVCFRCAVKHLQKL